MAGPTPVSALIHAATMVTAGVYMVARCNVLFRLSPDAMLVVAVVGGFTALFAATIGLVQNDIKKVLAYSTVSQLGYMFLACGVGAFVAGMFHVVTHAFFKACLFLGSGSVIHALGGEQDLRRMGGLSRKIPITYVTFLVATLAIAGVPLLAGFFSKDAILAAAFESHFARAPWLPKVLWTAALFTAGLTAFYMFRLVSLAFYGKFRGTPEQEAHVHESPPSMTVPLVVLAFLSVVGGWIGIPILRGGDRIGEFLAPVIPALAGAHAAEHAPSISLELALMAASVAVATIGLFARLPLVREGGGPGPGRTRGAVSAASTGLSRTSTSWTRPTRQSSSRGWQGRRALPLGGGRDRRRPDPERARPRRRRAPPGSRTSSTSTSWTARSTAWPARCRAGSGSSGGRRPATFRTTRSSWAPGSSASSRCI